jgi:hypothetical protein
MTTSSGSTFNKPTVQKTDVTEKPNKTVDMASSLQLSTAMTIQTQAKSKKRTKYRPVQRPDGVVVLQRPYRPASFMVPQALVFEKHQPTFVVPASNAKPAAMAEHITPKQIAVVKVRHKDLVDIGAHLAEFGRGGCNDHLDAGSDKNEVLYELGQDELLVVMEDVQGRQQLAPMERFLVEEDPWSTIGELGK